MDVANSSTSRPEDVLHEMAAGSEEIGARLLRLADAAAAVHRASVLDLLLDDAPSEGPAEAHADLNSEQVSAPLFQEESGQARGCDIHVAAAIRRTEVA
jgi:hypothetical protein